MIQTENNKKKDKKEHNIIVRIAFVILIIITAFICAKCSSKEKEIVPGFEKNVNEITEIDYSKQQEAINAIVEKGKMNVNYSPNAVFEGKTSVQFNIKNIKNNHAPIRFEIFDEVGRSIYVSKQIKQGYELNCIELEKELDAGTHDCTIRIGYAEEGNVTSVFPLSIEVE